MPKLHPRTTQELVASHFYIHSYWNRWKRGERVKNWPPEKIRALHLKYAVMLGNKFRKKHPGKVYKHESPLL